MPQHQAITSIEVPSGGEIPVVRHRFGGHTPGPRFAVVAGIRGDTPEGIRVAYDLSRFLAGVEPDLVGTVDVYPCANPLAAHRGSRRWPFFDVDLNRLFPGRQDGHPPHKVAWSLTHDIDGADHVIELRGAHPAFREVTQAHVRHRDTTSAELAMHANVAVVWMRHPGPAAPSTFAHQHPGTIVLEGGTGNRLTPGVSRDLTEGVLNLLNTRGVLPDPALPFHWAALTRPVRLTDEEVVRVRAGSGGLFMPEGSPWAEVQAGDLLGRVVDPMTGAEGEAVVSPVSGRLMAVREQPVVFPGSMVARVITEAERPGGSGGGEA